MYCDCPNTLRLELLDAAGLNVVQSLDLMDEANGYRVDSLDVAFPAVRAVVAALPTRDGDFDTTSLLGPRVVTVTGSLVPSPAGSRQAALQTLAYWCQPRIRPRLVYAVDADRAPQWLGLRGSQLTAPHSNPAITAFSVSWVAPDPVARALTTSQITISPASTITGRAYPLTFPRHYPAGGAQGVGTATNNGDYRAWPLIRFFGPCTNPALYWLAPASGAVVFAGCTVNAGDYLEVDTAAQSANTNGNPAASRYDLLDFTNTVWAGLEPGPTALRFSPATFSPPSQCLVIWADSTI